MPLLANTVDVADVPGAETFTDRLLELAGEDVRGYCGWHIAPVETTTEFVSGSGGPRLVLPSLRVVEVVAVTNLVEYGDPVVVDGWRTLPGGMLYRAAGWPRGDHNLQVTVRHGHDEVPPDLLAAVLERCAALTSTATPGVRTENRTVGAVSTSRTFAEGGPRWSVAASAVLNRYRVSP